MNLFSCPLALALAALLALGARAQSPRLPVLRATQPRLSIREGGALYRDVWGVSSAARPDVFVAQPFTGRQRVVFYSDQDSVAFWVKPRHTYKFVVLVAGQDSAFTQITTFGDQKPTLVPKLAYTRLHPGPAGPDTIRFQLDKTFGMHVQAQVNGSAPLDFLVDTGAGAVVLTAAARQRVPLRTDGQAQNAGTDGRRAVPTSSGNVLEIAGLRWPRVSLLTIDYAGGAAFDGVLGWVAFENRIVEIDYERRYLVIHTKLPALAAEYAPAELRLRNGLPFIKCTLTAGGQASEGWFDLDTGSDGGLVVGQRFAAAHGLTTGLWRLGTAEASGSAGGVVRQTIVALPKLKIGDYELYQLPLFINEQDPAGAAIAENIGSSILKRFNLVLDFQANRAYLRPNRYLYAPVASEPAK
jgi:predicted aspartyl protease